ncbi:MAG TPA: hypothetical protein VIM58_09170, partial [Candidatus Methylacidiphilales bacterium]
GNHRVIPARKYTAEEYAAYANATAAAMRAVDPSIKIGLVMVPGAATDVECSWNRTVVRLAGKAGDYLVIHVYGPSGGSGLAEEAMLRSCMAFGEQVSRHLDDYRAMALRESGRPLPLAVTEFNGSLGETVKPYRFSYAEALECADLLRVFLQPERQVLTASYWQFLNGYFGMLRTDKEAKTGPDGAPEEKPMYPLYRLWGRHFGTRLVAADVAGPRASFEGSGTAMPASGDAYVGSKPIGPVSLEGRIALAGGSKTETPLVLEGENAAEGAFALRFSGISGKLYPRLARFPRSADFPPGAFALDVSCEARFVPDAGSAVAPLGLGLGDSRGWEKTRSAVALHGITTEWKPFSILYQAPADATAVDLVARLETGKTVVSGRLEVRRLRIEARTGERFPDYPLLTASASLSADGKTLYLVVFNKSDKRDIPATVRLSGFRAASAKVWEVNGPGLGAFDGVAETVHGDSLAPQADGSVSRLFPAHSMTTIELSN